MSLDGKIATRSPELFLLGTKRDHQEMQRLRKLADAILIGASTLRSYKKPNVVHNADNQPINALLSSSLERISPKWPFFQESSVKRVLFVGHSATKDRIKKFEKSSEIVVLKPSTKKRPASLQIVDWFEKTGIKTLLVEGGGGVMWDFASAHLIQEYHVTLTPKIVGGVNAPTLVDGLGFLPKEILNLKLQKCQVIGDEIYLIYKSRS
jgi:5-amino-6-(5-phosphoribosylamino)uracil reductase